MTIENKWKIGDSIVDHCGDLGTILDISTRGIAVEDDLGVVWYSFESDKEHIEKWKLAGPESDIPELKQPEKMETSDLLGEFFGYMEHGYSEFEPTRLQEIKKEINKRIPVPF